MRFSFTAIVLVVLPAILSWLNYRLLSRLFNFYRHRLVGWAFLLFTVTTVLVMAVGWTRRPPFVAPELAAYHFLVYGALAWLFGQLILLIIQPFLYLVYRLIKNKNTEETDPVPSGMTRRDFLLRTLAATPLIAFGISTKGIYEAQTEMVVQRHSLSIPSLPANLNGFKISQISDTHLGPYFDLAQLDTAISLLSEERPDLVVITGDFADDLSLLKPAIERFNALRPAIPYGIYFCFGNHDYFRNAELVRDELKKSLIQTLDNTSAIIADGQQPFYLLGVDYPWTDAARVGITVSTEKRQEYFNMANRNVPPGAFKVLIAHHPDFLFDGFNAQIPLTLVGHTHGGQVVVGGKTLLSSYTYMRGLYRENGVYGYVSSGVGQWFPFRLGCPPEISTFILHQA
ncbi:MAG: metallophosphoesterase [Negativicutes bacterium]|nr:metallophosphoesterase [Negativicutes bacterium]